MGREALSLVTVVRRSEVEAEVAEVRAAATTALMLRHSNVNGLADSRELRGPLSKRIADQGGPLLAQHC
jgi:hypothetical protein